MATIVYGTHHFNKNKGIYDQKTPCSCGKVYSKIYIKQNRWFHIDYIPLIPLGSKYYAICPFCADGREITNKVAKQRIAAGPAPADITLYARHIASVKRYELRAREIATGEDMFLAGDLKKGELKEQLKSRGMKLKDVEIQEA